MVAIYVLGGDYFSGGDILSFRGSIGEELQDSTSASAISSHFYCCIIFLALGLQLTLAHCVHFLETVLGCLGKLI